MSIKFNDIFGNDSGINNPKLEELFNKTIDMAESLGKKSAEHLEFSRKRIECLDAKTKLSKLYEKYGELQYSLFIGEEIDVAELEDIANRISLLKEKISVLTEEIEEAKAQFSEAVSNAAKKTRSAFQKEFDKSDKNDEAFDFDDVVDTDDVIDTDTED